MIVKNKKGAVVHSHSALAVYMRIIAAVSAVVKRIFHRRKEKILKAAEEETCIKQDKVWKRILAVQDKNRKMRKRTLTLREQGDIMPT